jgi:hypothetical protein
MNEIGDAIRIDLAAASTLGQSADGCPPAHDARPSPWSSTPGRTAALRSRDGNPETRVMVDLRMMELRASLEGEDTAATEPAAA